MPLTQTSPNMGIVTPVVLTQTGPAWATNIYTALFTTIDAHDHTSGKGVTLQTSSMTVNADFPFVGFNATGLRSVRFNVQASPLALGPDIACLYSSPTGTGDLYWNNSAGTAIRITQNGVVAAPSSLTAPVNATVKTVTTTYAVDATTSDYDILVDTTGGAFTITLPVPANGRTLVITDSKGNFGTAALTLARNSVEKINGVAVNRLLTQAWGQYYLFANGTDWFMFSPGGSAPSSAAVRTITAIYSIDFTTPDYVVCADTSGGAFNVNLPVATNGRRLVIADSKGNFGTAAVTLVPNGAAKINGVNANRALTQAWGVYALESNGTDWFVAMPAGAAPATSAIKTVTTTYTVDTTNPDYVLYADTTGGAFTMTLPVATVGRRLVVVDSKGNFGIAALTLAPNGAAKIDGINANRVLATSYGHFILESNGTDWFMVARGLAAPVSGTSRTVTTTATVDSPNYDYEIYADTTGGAFTLTLPTPTTGRVIIVTDVKGNFATAALTLGRAAAEKIGGLAASRILSAAWGQYTITSNGTDWFVAAN